MIETIINGTAWVTMFASEYNTDISLTFLCALILGILLGIGILGSIWSCQEREKFLKTVDDKTFRKIKEHQMK